MTRSVGVIAIAVALTLTAHAQRQTAPQKPQDARRLTILALEDSRAPTTQDILALLDSARAQDASIQAAAVRALGRLERRDVITDLLGFLGAAAPEVRAEAANAVVQALRGEALPDVPSGQQERAVQDALLQAGAREYDSKLLEPLKAIARSLGRLPYDRAESLKST
jgi:HEAT repeat protein